MTTIQPPTEVEKKSLDSGNSASRPSTSNNSQTPPVLSFEDVEKGETTKRHSIENVRAILTQPFSRRAQHYLAEDLSNDRYLHAQLIFLTLVTGVLDAVTFHRYRMFISKQTGNIILLAQVALHGEAVVPDEPNVAASLLFFLCGAALFGHVGNLLGSRRRAWVLLSNLTQTALVVAALAIHGLVSQAPNDGPAVGVLGLLSFAMAGQIAMAIGLGMPELNTTMITGAVVQIAIDPNLLRVRNVARNRRVLFVLALFAGACVGTASNRWVGAWVPLLVVATCKAAVCLTFLLNRGRAPERADSTGSEAEKGEALSLFRVIWGD